MLYLLYTTDAWHTHESRELIGVAVAPENAISLAQDYLKLHNTELNKDDLHNLENISQTQNLDADFELVFEPYEIGELLI